jgi:hypothetical protein
MTERRGMHPVAAFVGSAISSAVLFAPLPAGAGHESVRTTVTKGLDPHLMIGEAWMRNRSGGTEQWDDFYTSEQSLRGPTAGLSVCDYQGGWRIENPDGSLYKTNYTAFHKGCSYAGYFQSTATAGTYAENKRFTALWKSDHTGGRYKTLGSMSD